MKVKKAWLIDFDGVKPLPELQGRELSLKDMYPIIGNGCNIVEHVGLRKGVDMWVDEEGLLKGEPILNPIATGFYRGAYPNVPDPSELVIVGRAILTDNTKAGDVIKVN